MTSLPSFCFKSGYKFSVSLDADVSVAVVGTRKSDTKRNFPCIALQCPVVLTSLKSNLVSIPSSVNGSANTIKLKWTRFKLCQWAGIAQLVVLGLAVHSVAGSILLWGHFPVEGIFPLELTWVQTPFPPKLFRMRV